MSLINIISAVGNNASVYPLLVRDCGIEIPAKLAMTYSQNMKDSKQMANNALRERFIDEYGTSAIWLGGIPLMDKLCNWGIRKLGYNPDINLNLFKENAGQGIELNIKKFKDSAKAEVAELEKVLKNKKTFEKLLAGKFILSTAIPVFLMGYCLPKMNFALTDKIRKQQQESPKTESKNLAFKGSVVSSLANMSTVNKMAVTDGGLTVGRVYTARNKFEKMEMAFKMTGMMFLNFVAPIWIAKGFDKLSNRLFNTNVDLDPKLLNDANFLNLIKESKLELPDKNVIEFLDSKPDSLFSELAEKYCDVKRLKGKIRDPRAYVDEKKVLKLKNEVEKFTAQAIKSGDVDKFAKKALAVKSANILANVALSSFLLAVGLPKLTFYLRKKVTGSDAEPGLVR